MEKGKIMKISAIGVTTFGSKSQVIKKASVAMAAATTGVAADTFVKGISKPDSKVEDFVKAHDDAMNDNICFDYSPCYDD